MSSGSVMHRPTTQGEVLGLLADLGESAKLVAGGTAFTILRKAGLLQPEHIVSVMSVPDLAEIQPTEDGVRIGALARLRTIERSDAVRARLPVLAATVRLVANARVRNAATLGGNVAEADPTSDPPCVLTALDAVIHLTSRDEQRDVPAPEFFLDYFYTALRAEELVAHIAIPQLPPDWGGSYVKFLSRAAEDRTCAGVAAFSNVDDRGVCHGLRLAVGGMAPVPLRLPEVEQQVVGTQLDERALEQLVAAYVDAADPVSDIRGSSDYRRRVMRVLIPEALDRARRRTNDAVFG